MKHSKFVINSNGTLTDNRTGLIWQRCAAGQVWTGTGCSGEPAQFSQDEADEVTSDFAGYTDWRLPRVRELQTIVKYENHSPAIDVDAFPNTSNTFFWTSSRCPVLSTNYWAVNFNDGAIGSRYMESRYLVRLVRDNGNPKIENEFVDHWNGTATDKSTGLMWQCFAVGQIWEGQLACLGGAETFTYEDALALRSDFGGFTDWRLPTASELLSIVDRDYEPAIDSLIFPNAPNTGFWSSSADDQSTGNAWVILFDYGFVNSSYFLDTKRHAVRFVRVAS